MKANVENLINRGLKGQSDSMGTIKCIGMEFDYTKMPIMAVIDLLDEYGDSNKEQLSMLMELIYMTIPVFRAKELQEQFKCVEPHDVVLKVLGDSIVDVTELGKKVIELYKLENVVDDVKK